MDTMGVPTYSRDIGGIRSDGQLYEMQRRLQEEARPEPETPPPPPPPPSVGAPETHQAQSSPLSFLRDLKMDDLLLLAIGFLLLTDSGQERNDLLFLLIGLLLLF